jgi:hypothetical protein
MSKDIKAVCSKCSWKFPDTCRMCDLREVPGMRDKQQVGYKVERLRKRGGLKSERGGNRGAY